MKLLKKEFSFSLILLVLPKIFNKNGAYVPCGFSKIQLIPVVILLNVAISFLSSAYENKPTKKANIFTYLIIVCAISPIAIRSCLVIFRMFFYNFFDYSINHLTPHSQKMEQIFCHAFYRGRK